MLAYIYPIEGGDPAQPGHLPAEPGGHPSHPIAGGGGRPSHPITIPPLPGIWPKPGTPSLPIYVPPDVSVGVPSQPIYIEGTPEHPITLPPNTIWPPLPPSAGIGGTDKVAVLIYVVGVGSRWFIYQPPAPTQPLPIEPQPKLK